MLQRCRSLHNYSSMVAIVSGLSAVPVHRLRRSWELVNGRFMGQLTACEAIIDPNKNFTNYRQLLRSIFPPCVPYIGESVYLYDIWPRLTRFCQFLGVFLTTLTFLQEGSGDFLPENKNLVNFRKRQKASEVIQDIMRWQSQPHNFLPLAAVLVYIEESLNALAESPTLAEKFWKTSLELEPREREDEKMARLLQESGFL